ncbi:MAG: hypothetical protein ACRDT4_20655 [Micromonosporaceae bacterium]
MAEWSAVAELTAERRDELAELLADQGRLRVEHPRVAEYLDTAPLLLGTGDDQADAEFDVRLVHYMTGDSSVSVNPYWDIVAPSVSSSGNRRVVNGGRPDGSARLAFAQTILHAAYAYAIPSPETIAWMSEFCAGHAVVELGAGRGYWAAQLSRAGLTIDAYDVEPPDRAGNVSFPAAQGLVPEWHPVGDLPEDGSRSHLQSDCVLFLCWPPAWGSAMASEALSAFERAGGELLVYIGEAKGGKTGDDAFFDALSAGWALDSTDSRYVSWWNLADAAQGWVRR